jgi:hypothetical protein
VDLGTLNLCHRLRYNIWMITLLISLLMSPPSLAFEVCNRDNDYLELNLPPAEAPATPPRLPQICVEKAHLSLPPTGFYGFCPTPLGRPARTHRRPCISERYVSAVHSSLIDVTDCFGYDVQLAYATFMLESAAHLNAVGAATDVGIGQLTKSAIDEVNLNAFDRAYRQALNSPKPSCSRILAGMTKHGSAIEERCGFMNLPENPIRNLIYSILLLQQNRRVINNLWARLQIDLPAAVDAERLKTLMSMLAYNSGPAGIVSVLKSYSTQMGQVLTDQHFDFEGPDEGGFARYLNFNFPSNDPVVRKRISKYVGHVMASARRMDRAAGGKQECVHVKYLLPPIRAIAHIRAQNQTQARGLVKHYASFVAEGFNTCHDFEFAFLGQSLRVQDLTPKLRAVHDRLCKK